MGGIETNIAAAALAISLVAFFIALGQLLQQYFATADGYRRCQQSVMGDWAKKTRLRWRWREFRFETLYTTPEIFFMSHKADQKRDSVILDGSKTSRDSSLIPQDKCLPSHNSHERVCWRPLLNNIHIQTSFLRTSLGHFESCQIPAIRFQESSWDFQLPDVVRPLAKTSVGAIAVIARRLGMTWKEFDPVHGIMRAEGNGQIITATTIRSLGTVVQYIETGSGPKDTTGANDFPELYIPVKAADSLGFGRITFSRGSVFEFLSDHGHDLSVGTRQQVLATLRIFEPSGHCASVLQTLYDKDPNYNMRMGDLVAILMDMVRPRSTIFARIPAPSENMLGFTGSSRGRSTFRKCLEDYCNSHDVGDQARAILQTLQELSRSFREWDQPEDQDYNLIGATSRLNDILHKLHESNRSFSKGSFLKFMEPHVLSAHIRFGIFRENGETTLLASRNPDFESEVKGYFDAWPQMLEAILSAHELWPKQSDFPEELGSLTSEEVEKFYFDVWISLLFRACCWGTCHKFIPGERVPSEWWGSELPVYIG